MMSEINIWMLIFTLTAGQGLFLSIILYAKKIPKLRLLATALALHSVMLSFYMMFWMGKTQELPLFVGLVTGFPILFGPYLKTYSADNLQKINKKELIPYLVWSVIFLLNVYVFERNVYISLMLLIMTITHLTIYGTLISKNVNWSRPNHWRQGVAIYFIAYTALFIIYYVLVWTDNLVITQDYFISLASSAFIYYTGYQVFLNASQVEWSQLEKYKKSPLSLNASQSILSTIKTHMEEEKAYLNNELKLSTLAEELGFAPHHISQSINECTGSNFSDFINSYQVNDAIEIINSAKSKPIFIEVAYDVGFNNKTSFYNAFKKVTSLSPSDYYHSVSANKLTA